MVLKAKSAHLDYNSTNSKVNSDVALINTFFESHKITTWFIDNTQEIITAIYEENGTPTSHFLAKKIPDLKTDPNKTQNNTGIQTWLQTNTPKKIQQVRDWLFVEYV